MRAVLTIQRKFYHMTREQAADYSEKRQIIMDAAAEIFARAGYPSAKLQDIAKACGASKSMLYHYFPTKDDLLFSILSDHLTQTETAIAEIDPSLSSQERLSTLVEVYILKSMQIRTRHIVAMNDMKYLDKTMQKPLVEQERRIVRSVEKIIGGLRPAIASHLIPAYTMLLFGMLNWVDLWYHPSGRIRPAELCDRITQLYLKGILKSSALPPA